jgi:hypothetical protein
MWQTSDREVVIGALRRLSGQAGATAEYEA